MKLIRNLALTLAIVIISKAHLFAGDPPPDIGNEGCGGPFLPPCPTIPITDHLDILFVLMILFFGVLKAYQYSRKTSVQS